MKKTIKLAGLMLMAVMGLCLASCGSDDDDDFSGGVDYNKDEIAEMLTGEWDVHGNVKIKENNKESINSDFTGTITFTKYDVHTAGLKLQNGNDNQVKNEIEEDLSIIFNGEYEIIKKNGNAYLYFYYLDSFKIVSLTKKGFKLIMDCEYEYIYNDGSNNPVTKHYLITVITN